MIPQLSKFSTSSEILINSKVDKVWTLLTKTSHLELVHPFCKSHKKLVWDDKNKIDQLTYINGLTYERNFYNFEKNKGFKLMIGKKDGKKSRVVWRLNPLNEKTYLSIRVTPYISEKYHLITYNFLLIFYILPLLKKYLNSVSNGIKYYLEEGLSVKQNQFGKHKWFSS